MRWAAGSSSTSSYRVYGKRESNSRDLASNYTVLGFGKRTLVSIVDSRERWVGPIVRDATHVGLRFRCTCFCGPAVTSFTAGGLSSGTIYSFQIFALDPNFQESNYVQFSYSTVAQGAGTGNTPAPGGTRRAIKTN